MLLIQSTGTTCVLAPNVSIKTIVEQGLLSIKNMKEVGKRIDEILLAHSIHIASNQHFQAGGKGDTSAAQDFLLSLYINNATYGKSAIAFFRDTLGMAFRVHMKDDDDHSKGGECSVELVKDRDITKIMAELGAKLVAANANGITQDTTGKYAKLKLPKKVSARASKAAAEDAPAVDVPAGAVVGAPLIEAINKMAASEAGQAKLAAHVAQLAEIMALLAEVPEDQLDGMLGQFKTKLTNAAKYAADKLAKDLKVA